MVVHLQKKRKRSLGSHATPDLQSGAPSQKRPRAGAAASSPSPLPRAQMEAEVRSGSSDLTEGAEGDTETGMTRKAARAKHRKKKLKGKRRAAATSQKAVTHGEKETSDSQQIHHSLQPHEGAPKTGAPGALDAPAGKSGKRKRGGSQVGAAGARQVPQEADEDLAKGTNAASQQLRQAANVAEPAEPRSPEQGCKKRRRNNRHGSGADALFLESDDDRDAPSRPRETSPQPSGAPVVAAATTPGKGAGTAAVADLNLLHELDVEVRRRTRAGLRSSGAPAKDISHFSPPGKFLG